MHCFICDAHGTIAAAVALCPSCHAGLCRSHVVETAWAAGPGGTNVGVACGHNTWSRRPRERPVRPSVRTSTTDRRAAPV